MLSEATQDEDFFSVTQPRNLALIEQLWKIRTSASHLCPVPGKDDEPLLKAGGNKDGGAAGGAAAGAPLDSTCKQSQIAYGVPKSPPSTFLTSHTFAGIAQYRAPLPRLSLFE